MALQQKFAVAFGLTALVGNGIFFVFWELTTDTLVALAMAEFVAALTGAGVGWILGADFIGALRDLPHVIGRLTKWDMSGAVPHTTYAA